MKCLGHGWSRRRVFHSHGHCTAGTMRHTHHAILNSNPSARCSLPHLCSQARLVHRSQKTSITLAYETHTNPHAQTHQRTTNQRTQQPHKTHYARIYIHLTCSSHCRARVGLVRVAFNHENSLKSQSCAPRQRHTHRQAADQKPRPSNATRACSYTSRPHTVELANKSSLRKQRQRQPLATLQVTAPKSLLQWNREPARSALNKELIAATICSRVVGVACQTPHVKSATAAACATHTRPEPIMCHQRKPQSRM